MKRRVAIIVLLVTFVVLIVLFWLRTSPIEAPVTQSKPVSKHQLSSVPVKKTEKSTSTPSTSMIEEYPPWHGGRAMSLDDPRWKVRRERKKGDPAWEWKMPIDFYGKAVDETGQTVSNVSVNFSWTDTSSKGTSEQQTTSNANGLFELHGVHGKRLVVQVQKEGYDVANGKNRYGFEYASFGDEQYYEADANNPVIFHLHKKGEAEPLIKRYSRISLTRDGKAVRFDLIEGKPSERGQIELQAWSSEKDVDGRYDWKLTIRVPEGGVKDTNEEFAFSAPESGYTPTFEINMPKSLGGKWESSVEQQVYVVFGNPPRYARINFRMTGLGENFYMDYWLNPSGSRNLEYDPEKQINRDQ